jgi:hypothetical protein
MKKFVSMALALTVAASMAVPAFAAEDHHEKVCINGSCLNRGGFYGCPRLRCI